MTVQSATAPTKRKPARKFALQPRILLVDDDERNLLALSEALAGLAEIVTATSGREALRHLLKDDFAVILLDVFMPGLDGYETAQLIREREQTSRIPIIFLSAVNKETEHLMRGYAMGAVDYVFKPVDPLILKSKVSVFVDLYAMRMQVEEKNWAEQVAREAKLQAEIEKLRMEHELRLAEQRQDAIINSLPIILYLEELNASPRIPKFVSGNFTALTGYQFAEIQKSPSMWVDRLHPEDRERVVRALEERPLGRSLSVEYRWQCADGQYKHFLDQVVLLRDPSGQPLEYAGTLLDVTDRKQLEAQLLQAGKMEAIGQLTGGVAHDFNNLLAAVLAGIQLLSRRMAFQGPEQRIIDQMRHAAEQGAELVRRMMAFARKQDLSPTTVDPQSLCDSVAGLVEHTLGGTVTIDWACPPSGNCLFVDRAQLELALVNLVLNARDAMPGGGTIAVGIDAITIGPGDEAADLPQGDYLEIKVTDSGNGMTPEVLEKITEPFFTTKEAGKGTGLGLSMVFGFVQQSGGRLAIESTVGEGTAVTLVLPARPPEPVVQEQIAGERDCTGVAVRSVLLVDDDVAVRTMVTEQLRDLGLEVFAVPDGSSALDHLRADPDAYDMLLTDFAMPGLNGAETIASAAEISPTLRFALMTGYADEEALASLDRAIPLIRKPMRLEDLEQVLR